ncbi:MAG: LysE family transporter [Candidatus Thalassarchaeaceae archaeon]|nr:MAG: LysE family translocator [Candidatus Poseidoniales archaeon]RCH77308.1 MAG: LysE family translocator [Candidatus Poseidoniales archaeon]|tara:strand:+ start:9532 stop:10167 length:636 start_codon:yes stop_codon:yes gene_type:complete
MDVGLVLSLSVAGVALGVIEGIKPGPLLTMVIRETLSGGLRAGVWTAAAPIFTDGPLIIVSLLAASWISTRPSILIVISILGAAYLLKMGLECFSIEPPSSDLAEVDVSDSFKRGVLTNLLNPNVYIFWFLIGGPLMASVADEEPLAPVAYAVTFLVSIIIVKSIIALAFDRTRGNLSRRSYSIMLSLCGVAMIFFAIGFTYQAYDLYQAL